MDKSYWNHYYSDHFISEESPFAKYCQENYLTTKRSIVELGCGSGRDLKYFRSLGHEIVGIDQSGTAIAKIRSEVDPGVGLIEGDFTAMEPIVGVDCVYSRWTLHSVSAIEASRAMRWVAEVLPPGGLFCIEVRSVIDVLYGIGNGIGRDEFETDHYRRFIRREELLEELSSIGFEILLELESTGLSVYKDDDPMLIRVVAARNSTCTGICRQ
ncbi:MAG: class I SAM-dependent methyltransferase [Verrucomicrobiales bacterium]